MQLLKRFFITGLTFVLILALEAPSAYAIMSPTIGEALGPIRQHVNQARQKHGVTSPTEIWEFIQDRNDEQLEQARNEAGVPAVSPDLTDYLDKMREQNKGSAARDSLSLILGMWLDAGNFISACLRDDIWELQEMREAVGAELLKSAVLYDRITAPQLWQDWLTLTDFIRGLKSFYKNPVGENRFFPEGQTDYYLRQNCPKGEFKEAIEDFISSFENFRSAAGAGVVCNECGWGNIATMARARARRSAQQYIRSNQFTLKIGGTDGASSTPLFKDGEFRSDSLAGPLSTIIRAWDSTKIIVGQNATKIYDAFAERQNVPIYEITDKVRQSVDDQQRILENARTTVTFNLSLSRVGENEIREISNKLFEINTTVMQASQQEQSLPSINKDTLDDIISKQCTNKQ